MAGSVLAGCGGDSDPKAEPTTPQPTPSVTVPDGVTLTKAGEKLEFGESATVAYEPNPQRSTILELTVDSVAKGLISDLGNYVLDEKTRARVEAYNDLDAKKPKVDWTRQIRRLPVDSILSDLGEPPATFEEFIHRTPADPAWKTGGLYHEEMGWGVPAGMTTACQVVTLKPGTPDSATVGTSGMSDTRWSPLTASARRAPSLMKGAVVERLSTMKDKRPAIRSCKAGALPL